MSRTPKEIDWNIVIKRMESGNSAETIANAFEITKQTFYSRFEEEFGCRFLDKKNELLECGKENVAYTQYLKALDGNTQMLLWLGEVWLGQKSTNSNNKDEEVKEILKEISQAIKQQNNIKEQ